MVKPASMTDAAGKAREIVNQFASHDPMYPHSIELDRLGSESLETAIAATIESAVQAERKLNGEARQALADAAREIPMAGPVADRIRALKEQHRVAMQAERERAGRLVDAAKAVQELQPKIGESPLIALRRHKKSHEQIQVIWDGFDAALAAYEVQP